ncbi:MAG: hypothetical protein HYR60_28725 [Acidobacteria bacterium]|nr:hypothetical protein [Acidobacteriota bacterium]
MEKMGKHQYQERLERISEMFAEIAVHADELSRRRCPYKNRFDQCTASFGCRNKRKPRAAGDPPVCASDDKLDYRGAWETGP